jgi:hypothetical protein
MGIKNKLTKIQMELKAPKGQYNPFGKYKYRSCEDILEAVKPILDKNKVTMTIKDDIQQIGDRYYIKATVTLADQEDITEMIQNTAYAREAEKKTGMDESQITGTASSYARKYALNGLFLIDDTKDADTEEYHEQTNKLITKKQIEKINELVDDIPAMLNYLKIEKIEEMTSSQADEIIKRKSKNEAA